MLAILFSFRVLFFSQLTHFAVSLREIKLKPFHPLVDCRFVRCARIVYALSERLGRNWKPHTRVWLQSREAPKAARATSEDSIRQESENQKRFLDFSFAASFVAPQLPRHLRPIAMDSSFSGRQRRRRGEIGAPRGF